MSLIVNTNVGSLNAQRSLAASGAELKTAMERLSSGKKINSATDDAAGFAIAERMTAQIRGLNMAIKNVNDGLSFLRTVDGALESSMKLTQRIKELSIQASNETLSGTDRKYVQKEVSALIEELDRTYYQTEFNGDKAFRPFGSGNQRNIQVGSSSADFVSISLNPLSPLDIHGLRHDAISRLSEKGMSVPPVTAISGHQIFSMLAHYVRLQSQFGITRIKPMPRGRENIC